MQSVTFPENRGKGLTGIDDSKYIYKYGCRIEADKDDKYQVVKVTGTSTDIQANSATVTKIKSSDIRSGSIVAKQTTKNDDDDTVTYFDLANNDFFLVNTSGNIQKGKSAAKDGNDWYFYTKDGDLKLYASDKNLKEKSTVGTRKDWEEYYTKTN